MSKNSNSRVSRVTKPKPSPDIRLEFEHEIKQGSDFVCLSAFSEVEGPCIEKLFPDHIIGSFNKKAYALKIMSVDLHGQNSTNLFVNDSQSVVQEGNFTCYVHHSYFLDLRARGYARPLSFSFITQDDEKIMSYFDSFMDEFTHVSNILKYGNHHYFINELEKQLDILDEEFKKQKQQNHSNNNNDEKQNIDGSSTTESYYDAESDFGITGDPESGFTTESSTDELLEYPKCKKRKRNVSVPKTININQNITSPLRFDNNDTDSDNNENNTQSDNDLDNNTDTKLHNNNDTDNNDIDNNNDNKLDNNSDSNSNESQNNESDTQSDNELDNNTNIIDNTELPNENSKLQRRSKKMKRENRSYSLPVHKKILKNEENEDNESTNKDNDNKKINSNTEITPQQAIRTLRQKIKQARHFYKTIGLGANKAIGELVTTLSNAKELKNELHAKLMKKRAATREQLRGFPEICNPSTYTFAMNRIRDIRDHYARSMSVLAIEREDVSISVPMSTMLAIGNCPVLNFNWNNDQSPQNYIENPCDISLLVKKEKIRSIASSDFESFSEESFDDDPFTPNRSPLTKIESPILPVASHRESHLSNSVNKSQLFDPLFPMNLPTASNFGKVQVESYAAGLWNQSKTYPGQNLFQLRHKYNFLPRIVYSLLIGRVVVIQASPSNSAPLTRLIRALSIFIPGCWRKTYVRTWQTEPLRIIDLSCAKLIGLSKEITPEIPKSIQKYITYMNMDGDEVLYSPPFDSSYIENILLPPKRSFPDESSFLAYIHAELYSLASKASLYYQMCCLHITQPEKKLRSDSNTPKDFIPPLCIIGNEDILYKYKTDSKQQLYNNNNNNYEFDFNLSLITNLPSSLRDKSKSYFENIFKVDHVDLPIIEYFAELIKEQQAMEMKELDCEHPLLKLVEMPIEPSYNRSKKK